MPRPLSSDLRKRIIDAKLRGDTESKIALDKSVSTSVVTKLWALFRQTGSYAPRPNPNGRKPRLTPEQLEEVRQSIRRQPDIALWELKEKYDLPVSISALSATIRNKLKLKMKKKRCMPSNSVGKMW
jgi:transposase